MKRENVMSQLRMRQEAKGAEEEEEGREMQQREEVNWGMQRPLSRGYRL